MAVHEKEDTLSDVRAFPIERLAAVAEDIADFFGDEGFVERGETLLIGPPMEVYKAGMVEPETPAPTMADVITWTERFHHQVLNTHRGARGYALTKWNEDEIIVCKISASAEFAEAVEKGLNALRLRMPLESIVRLVSVPEMQMETLWSLDTTKQLNSKMMVISGPEEADLELFHEITEDEFIEVLMTRGPLAGVMLPMMDPVYDRFLTNILSGSKREEIEVSDEIATTLVMEMEYVLPLSA